MAERETSRNRKIYLTWTDIVDVIGDAKKWPHLLRRLFWTKNLNHFQRILVCTFCYVNGLNPVMFEEWAELMGLCRDRAAVQHIKSLFNIFESGEKRYNLYTYNITQGRYEYLDGTPRRYEHRSQREKK